MCSNFFNAFQCFLFCHLNTFIPDNEQDKNLQKVFTRFENLLEEKFASSPVCIDKYSPSASIPMGGNNAKCCIVVSSSLSNGQSSMEKLLGKH